VTDILSEFRSALADRYDIEREIGRGGMATVLLARDRKHDRRVALKILDPELGAVLGHERFQSEIKVTATLQHPNLLPLFDSGEAAGQLFYVMPYVEGETLRARLERERQLPIDEAVRFVAAIAGALDFAHERGVIHRDLKPENILLQAGQPVVADFGIALAVSNAGGARVTQTGLSLGTPQYMSPEQATGERSLDARTDQYSLAAMAYEMLTGEPPHTGSTAQVIMARLMTETPRPVNATRASVPPHINAAIQRALSKAPADRFPTTGAFAAALAQATAVPRTPRRSWRRAAAVGGVLALAAVGAWMVRGRRAAAPPDDAIVLALPTTNGGDATLSATAASVDDALAQHIAALPWAKLRVGSRPEEADAAAAAAARAAGAQTAILTTLLAAGSEVQLRMRLIDAATGLLVRQLPSATIARNAPSEEVRRVVEPLAVAVGFVTSPRLGAATLPTGHLPSLPVLRTVDGAVEAFANAVGDATLRERTVSSLRDVVAADTMFLQAKLWLGFIYGWNSYISRVSGGAARADTVDRWVEQARTLGSPYEVAFAEVVRSNYNELGDASLEAVRKLLTLDPSSPLRRILPAMLLELNRPNEALRVYYSVAPMLAGDSSTLPRQASFWGSVSDVWHFVGRYDSALVTVRRARTMRPNDATLLGLELQSLAALGRLDEVRQRLPEVESAAQNGALFGFAGNVYLTLANELKAHGHPAEAKAAARLAVTWFNRHDDETRRRIDLSLRKAIALTMLGQLDEAERLMRASVANDSSDTRAPGMLARLYAMQGRTQEMNRQLAWLEARPAERLQGAPTYERAATTVNLGRDHWDEAIALLELSLKQGQGFGIRRRLHYFSDWLPLHEYPAFKRIITPSD
jgi:tetratricopeptide (TPR) repeat protein